MAKKQKTITGLFIGTIIFGGLGVFLLFPWLQNLQMARASKSWPSVQGRVASSDVVQVLESTDKDGKCHYSYPAVVTYNYSVEGQNHTGSRISFGGHSYTRKDHVQEVVKKYPAGKQVRVYYDPDFPVQAVLERRAGFGNFVTVPAGFVFLLGGIAMLIVFFVKLFRGK